MRVVRDHSVYGEIVGSLEPMDVESEDAFEFEENIVGGRIPKQYIPSVEKGFRLSCEKGPLARYPVVGVKVILEDGSYHDVDSSDKAFQTAAGGCFRQIFPDTKPAILEPLMLMEIECPEDYQGAVTGDIISRRGIVASSDARDGIALINVEVPLVETFGYATDLRSMTKGQGTFQMELARFGQVPKHLQEEIISKRAEEYEQMKK